MRHFYAVQTLNKGNANAFHIARNMGTSIQILDDYYGSHSTTMDVATQLGG
jgi:integrase